MMTGIERCQMAKKEELQKSETSKMLARLYLELFRGNMAINYPAKTGCCVCGCDQRM